MIRAVVLAAGKGTRMKSTRPKVLHALCGRPLLWWTLSTLAKSAVDHVVVVINPEIEHTEVEAIATDAGIPSVQCVLQEPQLGTGHAVQVALAALEPQASTLLILSADMPLVDAALLSRTLEAPGAALTMVTAHMPVPSNFGRVVRRDGGIERIVEARDASPAELSISEMNAAIYAFDEAKLRNALSRLGNDNAQQEYYLTDTIALLCAAGERIAPVVAEDYRTVLGVNDRAELAAAGTRLNALLARAYMLSGVTIVDPVTTYLEPDLDLAADVTLRPNTTIERGTRVGRGSEIGPNARLRNAQIGDHVLICDSVVVDSVIGDFSAIGPFAHVRGNSVVGTAVRIGNFVEAKNVRLEAGVKAAHLAYLGDAAVGKNSNIGAGTITANYDGRRKNRTQIGENVSIGSNSSLVAPVEIGDGALTGAGSVVTKDIPAGERVAGNPARPLPKKAPV